VSASPISLRPALLALLASLAACSSNETSATKTTDTASTAPKAVTATSTGTTATSQAAPTAPAKSSTASTTPAPAAAAAPTAEGHKPVAPTPATSPTTAEGHKPAAPAAAPAPATAPAAAAASTNTTAANANGTKEKEDAMTATALPSSFYGFKTTTLEGKPADLSSYKGKVVLVVNTASQCGLTPQYKGLEKLHEDYSSKGFSVLGFPSNDFGGQEPGTPAEIRTFCDTNYHVTFPLFSKVQTKAGDGQSPIYTWLQDQTQQLPRWNFGKYLIGKDGKVVQVFDSKVPPDDPALISAIDKAIGS
jgi:glutathione peroxidase